ncbi:hypothetical protein CB1_001832003 [Camelus ferus]|nr:hypothetical protein CB1_001832003 [Camelus ferus]
MPAAPWEDTPELSAFLRNSTIPHLVRKRDVAVLEPHRQSPAKILCGFFDRARPPQDDMNDRERLTNEKTPDA